MFKIFSFLLIVFGVSFQITAQCGGYFKESSRQVLSNAVSDGFFEDFDNDGLDDLLGFSPTGVQNGLPTGFQFNYYKRLTASSFDTTAKSSSIGDISAGYPVVFGDVNGDGKKDLIVRQSTTPVTLKTYLNDGTGRFLIATAPVNFDNESAWAASDLNNDGKADIVTISAGTVVRGSKLRDTIVGAKAELVGCELHDSLVGDEAVLHGVKGAVDIGDHSVVRSGA